MLSYKLFLAAAICMAPLLLALNRCQEPELQQELRTISQRDLVILYTKTKMDLAQVELDWANWSNEKVAEVISNRRLEVLKSELAIAQEQHKQATLASSAGLDKLRLFQAEEKARLTRLGLERAERAAKLKAINEFQLARAKLKYELAELNLAMLKNPENFVTLIEAQQGQIDQMGQELLSLDLRVTKLETN